MIDPLYALTIVLMASVTYFTRIGGYLLLRNRVVTNRTKIVLEAAPGCVLVTLIAPEFASGRPADMLAMAITVLAATRLPLLPTVMIAIGSAAITRAVFV